MHPSPPSGHVPHLDAALLAVLFQDAALSDSSPPPPPADADAELHELSWRDCLELLLFAVLAFCAVLLLLRFVD